MSASPPVLLRRRLLYGCALFTVGQVVLFGFPNQSLCQEFRVERTWEIGAVDGPPETIWSRIVDATILNGRVFAADIMLPTVRSYTPDGQYVGTLGEAGQGPGEFARPLSLTVVDDNLWVYDRTQDRWVIFDSSGEHLRTVRPEVPTRPNFFQRIWNARHGWSLGITGVISRRWPSQSITDHFVIAWKDSTTSDTLASIPANPFLVQLSIFDSLRVEPRVAANPAGGAWLLGDSLLVVVDGMESEATLYRVMPEGLERARDRTLPGRPHALTEQDRNAAEAWYYWRFNIDRDESRITEVVVPFESWSAWTLVRGDDAGGVWLRRGGPQRMDQRVGEHWVRWSLEEDSFRELQLPAQVEALAFRHGYVVALRRGAFGVEYLQLYRIMGL